MKLSILARVSVALFGALLAVAGPERAEAQASNRVYAPHEVQTPPKVKSDNAAAQAINRSYPDGMRSVGGRVQLRFVVQANGRVDPASIEVMAASATQLAEAAARAIQQIEFQPGRVDGSPVATTVIFPITYAAR
jgi:TonB family protein